MAGAASALDDPELAALVLQSPPVRRSPWATSHHAELAGRRVFVKRIPLTDVERANPGSTRNHFGLPLACHYGVGSPGFGAYRELAAHLRTTEWVRDGEIESFPLLYHSRVMPRAPLAAEGPQPAGDYVASWNGSAAVERYLRARDAAGSELWLVLEHVQETLAAWLPSHQSAVDTVLGRLCQAISVLRANDVVHFDAHLWNVLVSGDRVYLTDFGLVLDGRFELDGDERQFLARHSHYDYGEAIACVGLVLLVPMAALPPGEQERLRAKYGIEPGALTHHVLRRLIDRIDQVHDERDLPVEPELVAFLRRYRDVIVLMSTFLTEQSRNPRKDTPFDDGELERLLGEAGIPEPPQPPQRS